ncbi:leucine-rich repeat domain-containing protein [Dactylosporangium sp. NPDC000244]|uniref:leucine-rich repeat domain-containing protein n=1 Tax=Dactylosporangium sp. NPDC000244 TaxID=3154365 RepID=UPI00331787F6
MPQSLGKLASLTTLYAGDNQLTGLPEELADLTALTTLTMANNRLWSQFPTSSPN